LLFTCAMLDSRLKIGRFGGHVVVQREFFLLIMSTHLVRTVQLITS